MILVSIHPYASVTVCYSRIQSVDGCLFDEQRFFDSLHLSAQQIAFPFELNVFASRLLCGGYHHVDVVEFVEEFVAKLSGNIAVT